MSSVNLALSGHSLYQEIVQQYDNELHKNRYSDLHEAEEAVTCDMQRRVLSERIDLPAVNRALQSQHYPEELRNVVIGTMRQWEKHAPSFRQNPHYDALLRDIYQFRDIFILRMNDPQFERLIDVKERFNKETEQFLRKGTSAKEIKKALRSIHLFEEKQIFEDIDSLARSHPKPCTKEKAVKVTSSPKPAEMPYFSLITSLDKALEEWEENSPISQEEKPVLEKLETLFAKYDFDKKRIEKHFDYSRHSSSFKDHFLKRIKNLPTRDKIAPEVKLKELCDTIDILGALFVRKEKDPLFARVKECTNALFERTRNHLSFAKDSQEKIFNRIVKQVKSMELKHHSAIIESITLARVAAERSLLAKK